MTSPTPITYRAPDAARYAGGLFVAAQRARTIRRRLLARTALDAGDPVVGRCLCRPAVRARAADWARR